MRHSTASSGRRRKTVNKNQREAIIRGLILKILNHEYPNALSDETVLASLQAVGYADLTRHSVREDFDYLADENKKFLKITSRPSAPGDFWMAKLTAKGNDLLDGRINDEPGVTVAR
jgi:hypothetical protein